MHASKRNIKLYKTLTKMHVNASPNENSQKSRSRSWVKQKAQNVKSSLKQQNKNKKLKQFKNLEFSQRNSDSFNTRDLSYNSLYSNEQLKTNFSSHFSISQRSNNLCSISIKNDDIFDQSSVEQTFDESQSNQNACQSTSQEIEVEQQLSNTSLEKQQTSTSQCSVSSNQKKQKDAGHYEYQIGEIINKKYKILKHISDGTFGRVFEIQQIKTGKIFALKMIRAVERYVEFAKFEAEIIKNIQQSYKNCDENQFVKLEEAFEFKQNYCMVFEKLGQSLYDFQKRNNYKGFPISMIQQFFKQILMAINHLHQLNITHTDLKPENILLVNSEDYETFTDDEYEQQEEQSQNYNDNNQSEELLQNNKISQNLYIVPKTDKIKIIDLGGATYAKDHHSSVINTRQYRAPEVILGGDQWTETSDLWSIGCIILELYTGDLFFDVHSDYKHLAMMEKACGSIPLKMIKNCKEDVAEYFNEKKKLVTYNHLHKRQSYLKWPGFQVQQKTIKEVKEMWTIEDIIDPKYPELLDLLKKILQIDPKKRYTCKQALKHSFFKRDFE